MAGEMNEEEFKAIIERLIAADADFDKIYKNANARMKDFIKNMIDSRSSTESIIKATKSAKISFETYSKTFGKSIQSIEKDISELSTAFEDVQISQEDYVKQTKQNQDYIKNVVNPAEKERLHSMLEEHSARALGIQTHEEFNKSLAAMSVGMAKGLGSMFMNAGKSALAGGDVLSQSADIMKGGLDIANGATQAGAKGIQAAGEAASHAGGKFAIAGVLAQGLGIALGAVSSGITELAKAGIDFMLKQVQATMHGFQEMSAAGAIYTGSMKSIIKDVSDSGMSMDQFSKVVSTNKESLSKAGLGMTDGSKRLISAMKEGGAAARNGMFALGMSLEEQGEAYAVTMSRLAGPMGRLHASDAQVAAETEQYAKDLKLISDITGKSAKDQQAQSDAAMHNLRMQQEVAKMLPEAQAKFRTALGGMDESSKAAIAERMALHGAVGNKDIAQAESLSPALKRKHEEEYDLAKKGLLTGEAELALRKKYASQINTEIAAQEGFATAAGRASSSLGTTGEALTKEMEENAKIMQADANKSKKNIEDAFNKGKLGKKPGEDLGPAELMAAQQDQIITMQKLAADNMKSFADALLFTSNTIMKAVNELASGGALAGSHPMLTGLVTAAMGVLPVVLQMMMMMKGGAGAGILKGAKEMLAGGASGVKNLIDKAGGLLNFSKATAGANIPTTMAGGMMKGGGVRFGAPPGTSMTLAPGGLAAAGQEGTGFSKVLDGLAKGLKAFANPQTALGLGAVTLAIIGLAAAFRIAGPAMEPFGKMMKETFQGIGAIVESFGKAIGTVVSIIGDTVVKTVSGLAKSLGELADIDPIRLLAIVPGMTGIGLALIPFSAGGALAGLLTSSAGFKNITDGLKDFESLNPDKLIRVAEAMKKVTDNLPSAADIAKMAIVGLMDTGNKSKTNEEAIGSDKTSTVSLKAELAKMIELLTKQNALAEEALGHHRELVSVTNDHKRTSEKLLNASS